METVIKEMKVIAILEKLAEMVIIENGEEKRIFSQLNYKNSGEIKLIIDKEVYKKLSW